MRTTRATLERIADNCNREAPVKGWKYTIEYAYGRPRLVLEYSRLCCRDVSPRLPKGKLADWIWAYLKGIEAGKESAKNNMDRGVSTGEGRGPGLNAPTGQLSTDREVAA